MQSSVLGLPIWQGAILRSGLSTATSSVFKRVGKADLELGIKRIGGMDHDWDIKLLSRVTFPAVFDAESRDRMEEGKVAGDVHDLTG